MIEASPVSFDNTAIAFAGKNNAQLRKAYWLFKAISQNWLVKAGPPLTKIALSLKLPIKGIIKSTIFSHFCGGENINDCNKTITSLSEYGVGTILDYSVEGEHNESAFDACVNETIATIERAKNDKNIPFCVFKVTGLARYGLLEKLDISEKLSEMEEQEYFLVKKRVNSICEAAYKSKKPLFIDAEETWIQKSIDNLAYEMMALYNKELAIIYNTIQMYRTDGYNLLTSAYTKAKTNGYILGIKLVRGAYMEKERARASKMGYSSPINSNKAATDMLYDKGLTFCAEHINNIALCAGTHNEASSRFLIELMQQKNIDKTNRHIYFSQLLGMSDHISFNLANAHYNVAKYVPYGPVTSVLPYLIRRANENTSISGQTGRELSLLSQERARRGKN